MKTITKKHFYKINKIKINNLCEACLDVGVVFFMKLKSKIYRCWKLVWLKRNFPFGWPNNRGIWVKGHRQTSTLVGKRLNYDMNEELSKYEIWTVILYRHIGLLI